MYVVVSPSLVFVTCIDTNDSLARALLVHILFLFVSPCLSQPSLSLCMCVLCVCHFIVCGDVSHGKWQQEG